MKFYKIISKQETKVAYVKLSGDDIIITKVVMDENKKIKSKEEIKSVENGDKELVFRTLLQHHDEIDRQSRITKIIFEETNKGDKKDVKDLGSGLSNYFKRMFEAYLWEDDDFLTQRAKAKIKLSNVELIDESEYCEKLCIEMNKKDNGNKKYTIKTLSQQFTDEYYDSMLERTSLLEKIESKLEEKKIVGLVSGPGCGKTSLAAKYAHDKEFKEYEEVYFIQCDTINSFKKSLKLDITDDNIEEIGDIATKQILNIVDNKNKYLLIFDNISYDDIRLNEDDTNSLKVEAMISYVIDSLYVYFQGGYDIDIIYTSRANRELADDCNIKVSEFSKEEAKQYLTDDIDFEYTDDEITNIINSTQLPIVLSAIKNYAKVKKTYKEFTTLDSNTKRITLNKVMEIIFKSFTSREDMLCKMILRICSVLYNTININLLLEVTEQLGKDSNGVKQAIRKLSENLNLLVYRREDELYLHRSYQEVILASCMEDDTKSEKEIKIEIYDAIINVFKTKINRYLTFSIDTAIQIEENILHINKILVDQNCNSNDFYYILLSCIYYYGSNYSRDNEYFNRFSQYILKNVKDRCITYINNIYISRMTLTNIDKLIKLTNNSNLNDKHIILPIAYYALGSIYRELNTTESDTNNCIENYEKCYDYARKQRDIIEDDNDLYIFYTQYMLMAYFRICQVYRKRREYDKRLEKLQVCDKVIADIKDDYYYESIIGNHLEYIEARLKNEWAVYYMENSSTVDDLKTGLQCELESYEIYIKYYILHEKKNIIYNLSLYYKKLAEKLKIKEKEYNIYIYMSLYFVELYRILRDKLGTVRYDNSGNYYNQTYLSVYKTLDFNKNISITKEDIIEKISSLGDEIAQDIMSYDNGNMIDKILNKYPIKPDNATLFKECDELLTNALKQYSNQNTTLEQYANLDDDEREVNQYIARVIRYYASLNKKMYQITEDDTYYKNGVKFLKLSIELNKILNNNGQLALCLRELYVLYDMSAQKQSCFINECYKKKSYYKKECRLNKLVKILSDQFTKDVFGKLSDNDGYKKAYINKCKELEIELDF